MKRKAGFITSIKKHPLLLLGHLSFIVLFIFSVYFFRERVIFSDTAFQFFKIVNFEKINIEASRYGAILPQVPLLIAMKFGFSLKWLTIIYSSSFILLYYLVFICCAHLLKNVSAGLAVVLVLTLSISQSFFHPVTETHQSLVFVVLIYALLHHSQFRNSLTQVLLVSGLIVFTFFIHPIAVYPLVFVVGYVAIDRNQIRSVKPYALLLLVVVLAIAKVLLTDENSYEGKFFSQLIHSPSLLLDLPNLASTDFFLRRLDSLYLWLGITELAVIIIFIQKKKFKKLFWQLITAGFFLVVTLLTYAGGDSTMLMERAFMPLALFVAVPLLNDAFTTQNKRFLKVAFLALIIGLSMNRIYQQGRRFQERTDFNRQLLIKTTQFSNNKFILEKSEIDKHIITFWSHSFETLLLSAITKDIPTQTIYPAANPEDLNQYTTEPNSVFLGASFWLEWNIESLNSKYFDLPDNSPYKIISLDDFNL